MSDMSALEKELYVPRSLELYKRKDLDLEEFAKLCGIDEWRLTNGFEGWEHSEIC